MNEHQVQIALPIHTVHQAWRRYVGYVGTDAEADGDGSTVTWRADDGSGLSADFVSDGPDATVVRASRRGGPDAAPASAVPALEDVGEHDQNLGEFLDGFLEYAKSAFMELDVEPGAAAGDGLAGPDGTSHTHGEPTSLGTDQAVRGSGELR